MVITQDKDHELDVLEVSGAQNASRRQLDGSKDGDYLVRLGKKPVLKVRFHIVYPHGFLGTMRNISSTRLMSLHSEISDLCQSLASAVRF